MKPLSRVQYLQYLLVDRFIQVGGEDPFGGLLCLAAGKEEFAEVAQIEQCSIMAAGECFLADLQER